MTTIQAEQSAAREIYSEIETSPRPTLLSEAMRFQHTLAENPQNAEAMVGLAIIALVAGQPVEALRMAHAATEANPNLIPAWIALGEVYRQQNQFLEAEESYRHALMLDGMSLLALIGLGELKTAAGNPKSALPFFDLVLSNSPMHPAAHMGRGHAYACLERGLEALEDYEKVIATVPKNAEAHFASAFVLNRLGRFKDSELRYRRAIFLRPDFAAAWMNLGQLLLEEGRAEEAFAALNRSVQLKPNLVTGWVNLANLERDQGRKSIAEQHLNHAFFLDPTRVETLLALSHHANDSGDREDAWKWLNEAAKYHPDHPEVANTRGILLNCEGKFQQALVELDDAVQKGCRSAHSNRANVLIVLGRTQDALAGHQAAVERSPHYAGARYNLALTELRLGQWSTGWPNYEARWRFRDINHSHTKFRQPRWQGEALVGRSILLHAEQGLGDTIQFCRYAPLVAARGGQVILQVQPAVERLIASLAAVHSGAVRLISMGSDRPPFDLECPLMSLPALFHTTTESVPWFGPYLAAEPALKALRSIELEPTLPGANPQSDSPTSTLNQKQKLRIGLSWAGNPRYKADSVRSTQITRFVPFLRTLQQGTPQYQNLQFVSLQKGDAAAQLAELGKLNPDIRILDGSSADADFAETAALAANLDLILTTDTAVAHMAAAMGLPVWMLLAHHADWRWMENLITTPWYPTLRIFRQQKPGDWESLLDHVLDELQHFQPHTF